MPDPVVPPVINQELKTPSSPVFEQSMYDNTKGPDMGFDKPLQNIQSMDKLLPSAEEYAKSISYGPSITDLINQIDGYKETMQGMIDNFGIMSAGVSGTGFNTQKGYSNFLQSINPAEPTMDAFNKPMIVGPESGYKRYAGSEDFQALGYTPGIGDEQEYKYGRSMTWGDTVGKAFGGASRLAADTFVEGWKGWGRMFDALTSWDSSKLMGTPEEQYEMAQRQEDIMNKYAIYDTAESKDGIFNRQFFGNMLQQSGFAIGAGLQFAAEELLTAGLASAFSPLTKGLALGRMIKTTEKAGDLINDARKVMDTVTSSEKVTNAFATAARKIVPLYGTAEDMVKLGKAGAGTFQLTMTGLGGVRRSLSEFNMARSESIFESAGTYKRMTDNLTQEYKDKYGVAPTGDDLEKIKQHAEDASHDNFWTNVGVLSVMNRIQFDNMFKGFNTTRKIFNTEAANLEGKAFEVAGKIAGKEETRAFTTGTFGRLSAVGEISKTFGKKTAAWEATKSIGKGLMKFEGSEGMQELIQTASDQGLSNYYTDLYHGAKGYGTKLDNVMEELYKERPWASTEGLKTFLMGALTGRLISPITMLQERTLGRAEYKDKKVQAKEAVNNLNAFYSNPDNWLKESIANVKVQNKAAETMEEAAKNHNRYVFNNYKDSAFGKAVASAIKLNMFESMRDTIKGYGENMTNDEFKQAFGIEATAQNKKDVKNFMSEVVSQMEEYHTTYQNLKDKYADRVLPELYKNNKPEDYFHMVLAKKAVDDAIETLTTNVHKSKQAVKRASGLQTEISANPNIGSSSIEVLTKMGSEEATQKHIEMLEKQIQTTEEAGKAATLTPDARKILNDQKEELKLAKKWQQSYKDLLANTDESYSPSTEGRAYQAFADMINLFNKRANNTTTVAKEDVDDVFIKFNDYIRLNEDNKGYVDAMNLLADPTNLKLITQAMASAIKATQEDFKAEQEEELNKVAGEEKEPAAPKKSTIIKTVDKDGKPVEFELVEGESYITESSPERRVYKGKYPTTVYNQDVLKIVSINDDGSISFTYNNEGEAITMTAEEFAEIGKLYPLSKMSVPQRIYFRNRDLVFDLNVYKETGKPHYNKGKHANKDYSAGGINVKARFELVKEGDDYVLKVTYINPVTKLKESIDYDAAYLKKYASNKKDLFDITEAEQDVLNKRTEARRLTQIRMLTEAIANIVPNREKLLAERNKNEEDYEKIRKELEDYVAEMELIEERFKAKPYTKGRKSKERVELEARQEVLRNLIKNAENLIERFDAQATEIEKQLDSLNQLSEYYSEGVKELEESGQPYSMQEGKIYGAEEIKLKEAQGQQLIKRNIDNKTIDALVDDTQAELDLVNERITILQRIVDYSNKVLNRISKVTDLLDALENITDKKQLLNQLVLMKRQETDADNKQTIQNLINAVNKGDSLELAYIYEAMDRMNEAKEEIANLLEEASYLQDKYDRLSLAKQQRSNISALEYRLDMLKAIQEELLARYAAAQEKAVVKQEGAKVIVKNTAIPVEDDLIKGADALFTTQPISDVIPGSEEDKDPYIMMDAFMPILDGNALYKTAGRHFADLKDTTLASAQDARFFKFSETAKLSDENGVVYFLMPITKDSKDYQDLRFSGYADDIRLVVVKRDGAGGFKPVGMDGNILETPTKDNMIYIGMHGGPELMSDNPETVYSWLSENFAIFDKKTGKDRVSKEQALAIANSFKQAREAIKQKVKAGEKVILPIVDKSPGVYNREPLTGGYDENGNPVPQRPQEISLEGRLIEANPDFSNLKHPDGRPTKLEVSTTDSRVKAGRVMMTRLGEPGIVVYNRKFTEAEHQNIIDILKRVSELFIQKNTQEGLTEEQNTEFTTAVKYLQGITFWSPLKEGAEPYSFQLTVNNGLNIGKEVIPFTSDSIEQNKDKIKQALEYHKVNNRFLSDKLKDEPFYDVKAIDGKIIKGKQYLNYQHYLLADRPGGSILYTNMKEYVPASENKLEPQHYQLKNVYFKYDASSYITEPVQEPGDQGTVVDKDNIKQYSVQQTEKTANGVTLSILENNIPKEGKVTFVTTKSNKEELYLHTEYKNGKYEIFQIIDEKGNDLTNVQIQGKSAKEQYQSGFEIRSIDKQLENLSKNAEKTQELKVTQTEILDLFKETFIRIEDYAKQGEVMNDVKASEIVTASVVPTAPVTPTPVSNVNSLIDKRVIEDELTKGRYSFYPTEQAAKENKGVVITKDNVNQAIETENKLGDVIYDNKSNKITGIPTPEIKVSISSGTSIVFENAKDLEEFINNPKNNAQERVKAKAEYDRLASIQSTTPTQTTPVAKPSVTSVSKTYDDYVNDKYKRHVTETKSNGGTPLSRQEFADKFSKQLETQYKLDTQKSIDQIVKDARDAAAQDDGGYDANTRVAEAIVSAKLEDVDKFKEWLNKVLPQIPLNIVDELIDGKYFGQFLNGTINMYKLAEEGTGFHEAFEAVWNSYLSAEKQLDLIDEYKNRPDYKSLPSYKWAEARYKTKNENIIIKEALAEEFREYMLTDAATVKPQSPKRNTFFRKIWNFIKKLLGLSKDQRVEMESKANELFSDIGKGKFKNIEPVQKFDPSAAHNRAAISGTSVEFTQQLMEGMTAIFFSKLSSQAYRSKGYSIEKMFDENNNIFETVFKDTWSTVYNRFVPGLNKVMESDAFIYSDTDKQNQIIANYVKSIEEQDAKINSDLFEQKKRAINKDVYNTEVRKQFKDYLSQFGLKFKQVEDNTKSEEEIAEIEGKEEQANALGIRDVIYIDPTSLTNPTVRLLILSLPNNKQDEFGNVTDVRNKLNLPSLVSYKRKMNILFNELSNTVPMMREQPDGTFKKISALEEMFTNLDKKFKDPIYKARYKDGYEWVGKLKSRLKFDVLVNGGILSNDEMKLIVAFETSFTRNKNNPLKVLVGADGKVRHVNSVSVNTTEKIKEEWKNNIKETAYKVDISKLDTGGILYINPDNRIEVNLSSPRVKFILGASDVRGHLAAFNALGITLSTTAEKLSEVDKNTIKKAYNSLKYVMEERIKTNTSLNYDDLFDSKLVAGPLNSLLALELNYRSEDTLLSHQTAEGKTQYAITLPSEISYVVDSLNSANSLQEFIMSNPQYGKVVNGVVTLNPYNASSEILTPGGLIFDNKGRKRENAKIEYEYISGMASDKENGGDNTDSLNFNDKIVQEIYHLLRGSYFTVINSDKSSEFAVKMGHFVKMRDIADMNFIEDKYVAALRGEVMHALRFHFFPNNIKNHQKNILMLGHFSGILGFVKEGKENALQQYFNKLVKDTKISKKTKPEDANLIFETLADNFAGVVKNQGVIKDYVSTQVDDVKTWLLNKEIVKPTEIESLGGSTISRLKALGIPKDSEALGTIDPTRMTEVEFTQLIRFLTVNRQLGVFEQHKLFYGHPAMYKDLAKRANGANSQKNVVSENPHIISWMEQNKPRYDGRKRDAQNPFVRNISYADPITTSVHTKYIAEELYKGISKTVSKAKAEDLIGAKFDDNGNLVSIQGGEGKYLSGYINMKEADAQAGIMPDYFRDLMYLSGSLSNEQEALLDWENASEIIDRSKKNHPYYNPKYTAKQIADAQVILDKGRPTAILQVLKPQGFGFQNTDGMSHIDYLKNSVLPLTWSRVKNNPDMLSKYINAQNNGVDIIGFDSGHKVGVVTNSKGALTPFYNQDGTISTETPVLQDIFSKYVGIQVQTPDYAKNKVIFGSQVRKLILSDLPESLKPYAQEYRDVLNKLLDIEKTDLIKELGLKPKSDGSYEIENAGKLMEMLRQEAIKRNLPDNIVEMLGTFMDDNKEVPKYPLDANPARERIESVLNSIVDNRIIRTEMFGKANVQVASAFFSQGRKLLYIKDGKYEKVDDFSKLSDAEKKTTVLASTDLNFYNKEKPYMEVYTPWYFKGISPEEAGFVQNKEGMWIAPEGSDVTKLLNSIGFRIPTQGLNSIDSIVIKGFLDPSYGDMVVVPSEMVGKSGSDFDIDKLNMFLANYHVEIEKLSFEELGEFRSFYSYDNLPKYIREWFNGLSKEEADAFVDDLNKFSVTSGYGEYGNLSDWLEKNNITGQQADIYESFKNALVQYNQYKRDLIKRNKAEAVKVKAKKLVYIDPAVNTGKKGLQNRVLEIMKTIVEHPDNQRQLLTPNSSAKLKALSLEILKLKGIVKVDDDMTKLSEWKTMSETRETFVTSKQLVGIGALQITSHAMSQIGEVELTGKYVDFDGTERDVVIKLPNSNTNKLNLTIDDDGMFIFDLFNEALTGSVDAAKDPFIFDIRLNLDTASTWFYLTKRGVSQENIALMFNQPVMDDYFKYRDANDTYVNEVNDEKDYFNNIIIKAAAQYYTEATGKVIGNGYLENQKALASFRAIQDQFKNYSTKDLKSAISSKGLTKQQNLMQVAILMDMLDYREQANKLSNFVRGISYDTNKTKNIVENYLQRARYNIAVNDNFVTRDSIDRVFNNTFLGKIKETKEDVLKMFENFFIVLNPKSLKAFEPILEKLDDDKLFMTNDAKADMLNRYQNFFITHVLQNTTFGNNEKLSQYYNLFTDGKNESLAKRLKKMKAKYPESVALKNFYPLINQNRNSPDGIKMFNNKMSPYEINAISESIDILHTQAEMTGDVELKEFIDNLARFAILQSGVQLSPITFTKVLPIDLYAGLTADIFKNFTKDNNDVDVDQIWKAFHQNNWKNNKIVPTLKANPKKRAVMKADGDGLLKLDRGDRMVKNKYFKMYTKKEGVALEFDVTLYERVKVTDATGKDITLEKSAVKYRPINKLGNGMYVMETTPDLLTNASRFDINGDVAENSFDPAVKTWRNLLSTAELVGDRPEFDKLPGRSATPTMTYAGIGSRETPQSVINQMTEVAKELQSKGYTLNTGKTFGGKEEGADQAFSMGTTKKNLFAPEQAGEREKIIAREIHPAPDALSDGGMKLMARNTNQIFGANLDTPVDFVLFYAEDKGKKGKTGENRPEGGTGQAVEMARAKGIPTINMQDTDWKEQLKRVLDAKPVETSADVKRLNGIKEFIKLRFGNLQGTELVDAMLEDKKEMFEDTVKLFMKLNPNMSKEEIDKGIEEIKNTYNYISVQVPSNIEQKSLGNIKLNIIEDWVQSGQATTTVRSSTYHNSFYKGDGIYTTDKGNLVNITYKGLVKLQGDRVVGNNVSYTKDEFAKAEGFGTWANFQKDAKYAGRTLINGDSVHLYNITPAATTQVDKVLKQMEQNSKQCNQ